MPVVKKGALPAHRQSVRNRPTHLRRPPHSQRQEGARHCFSLEHHRGLSHLDTPVIEDVYRFELCQAPEIQMVQPYAVVDPSGIDPEVDDDQEHQRGDHGGQAQHDLCGPRELHAPDATSETPRDAGPTRSAPSSDRDPGPC